MQSLYDLNGLVHWDEREIDARDRFIRFLSEEVRSLLLSVNPAWAFRRVEAPLLVPRDLISSAYTEDDVWVQQRLHASDRELVLRPETTPSTYVAMQSMLNSQSGTRLPLCVWQAGKSFRREQDQPSKFMRLKEFHQLEFQAAYAVDTFADYHALCLEPIRKTLASAVNRRTRVVPSDRLPAYSQVTMDVEAWVEEDERWMEVCSISRRTDFPQKVRIQGKKETREVEVLVLEIAIGLDRCIRLWSQAPERS